MSDEKEKQDKTPPQLKPFLWEKGKSGNPEGRRSEQQLSKRALLDPLKAMLRMPLDPKMRRRLGRGRRALQLPEDATYGSTIATRLLTMAILGDLGAAKLILAYTSGYPVRNFNLQGEFDVSHSHSLTMDTLRSRLERMLFDRNTEDGSENQRPALPEPKE